jgi:hypothetical protein
MEQAHDMVLHPHELDSLHWSMGSVLYAVFLRLKRLQGRAFLSQHVLPDG